MITPPLPGHMKHSNLQKCGQNSSSTRQKTRGRKQTKQANNRTGIIFHSLNSKSYTQFKSVADLENCRRCQASDHTTQSSWRTRFRGKEREAHLPLGLHTSEVEALRWGSAQAPFPFEPHKSFHPTKCVCVCVCGGG